MILVSDTHDRLDIEALRGEYGLKYMYLVIKGGVRQDDVTVA